jgi:tetratricopeptide (TPR) repeat protein
VRRVRLMLIVIGLAAATAAQSAEEPVVAPAEAWVDQVPIPGADASQADKPLQPLLFTAQSRYADRTEYYVEWASLVQTPQGLAAMGNLVIPWQPDRSELRVHKAEIRRGGAVIDLLARTQPFTVLRRENNLEAAMLDGVLTAVMQPEGLAVGDIVHLAYTLRMKPGSIAFQPEHSLGLDHGIAIRRILYREIWPEGTGIRWRASDAMGKARLTNGRWGKELVVDLRDAQGPKPPEGAPPRFQIPAYVDVSAYRDWAQISRLLAPAYASAMEIGPDSPLQAEIRRIAATGADPKKRAMAALRLVQDQIRYLALAMGDGGYVPATADHTWARRFGDCKGKTATLLALLNGLGIEAEPVLVSSRIGDWLPERLPQVSLFDHVIVRARLDGRFYWLDGTRSGDRDIEELASTPFRSGLPVTAAGADLERLPLLPPRSPLNQHSLTYDASAGFHREVPVTGEFVFRGDFAALLRAGLAQATKEQVRDWLRQQSSDVPEGAALDSYDFAVDEATGAVTFRFSGKADMDWPRAPDSTALRFRFDDETISWQPDLTRDDGPFREAPFALGFPVYLEVRETVILPDRGAGFTLEGSDLDASVAGARISRTLTLANGRATAHSTFRQIEPEISAAEARAAAAILDRVNADRAYVRTPPNYQVSAAETEAIIAEQPATASGHVERGFRLMGLGRIKEALADFDKAIALSPNWSRPHADRGVALIHQDKFAEAKVALDKAASLSDSDFVVPQGYGMLHLAEDRPQQAVEAFTRALALEPDEQHTLFQRSLAYQQLGRLREALADVEAILARSASDRRALSLRTRLLAALGDIEAALQAADAMVAAAPDEPYPVALKAELLARAGRAADSKAAYARALSLLDRQIAAVPADQSGQRNELKAGRAALFAESGEPRRAVEEVTQLLRILVDSAHLLNLRCWARAMANIELDLALRDCNRALEIDPGNPAVADSRGYVKLRLGRLDEAMVDFNAALGWQPRLAASLYGRGLAKLRKGDRAGGEADLAAARRRSFDIDAQFGRYGLSPPEAPAGS